uniref:CDK5 and ABL1 enzyme substrate 2 n=1 Tax=Laticauda laticaudata TaxID=8630 RepID=A0A8C5SM42_LATLA
MAAAACGSPTSRPPQEEPPEAAPAGARKRGGDARRRQAALFFLNNISLDGRPPSCPAPGKPSQGLPASPAPGEPQPPPQRAEEEARGAASAEPAPRLLLPPTGPHGPPPGFLLPPTAELDPSRGLGAAAALLPQLLLGSPLCPVPAAAAAAVSPAALAGVLMGAPKTGIAPPGLLSPTQGAPVGGGGGGGLPLEVQRQRMKHISGSPRHKGLKKVHFIKNMRQYDTRNSRIVLICAKRTLCVAFSILPYGESLRISELRIEGQKQRHPSGGISATSEMVFGMEGVELGADGKVVSYAKFLYPTNALMGHKSDGISAVSVCRASASRTAGGSRYKTSAAKTIPSTADLGKSLNKYILPFCIFF